MRKVSNGHLLVSLLGISAVASIACSSAGGMEGEDLDTNASAMQADPGNDPKDTDGDTSTDTEIDCYVDGDKDGVGAGSATTVYGTKCPSGYSTSGTDCNDKDATVSKTLTCYKDSDKDGLGSSSSTTVCANSCPTGYVTNKKDCDDTKSSVGSASLSCYTDNDKDSKGGTLAGKWCGTTCPTGLVTNYNESGNSQSGGAIYLFERTGTADFAVQSFTMTFINSSGDTIKQSGDSTNLSTSKAIGNVAQDGTFTFDAANFVIVYKYTAQGYPVTVTLTANKNIVSKIDPSSGNVSDLSGDFKLSLVVDQVPILGSVKCAESSIPIKFKSSAPYNSSNGTLSLTSNSFTIDATSGDASCGAVNKAGGLPGTGTVSFSATAKSPFPISSWPRLY